VAASAELTARASSAPVGNGGTSAAAAAVSAISGLLLSCNPALTAAHVKEILIRTSTPYDVDVVARGEVDAYRALLASGCDAPDELELDTGDRVKLRAVVRGGGTVSRQPAGRAYEPGTIVTLHARPRPGWSFAAWRGPCAGKGQLCRLSVIRPVTVVAVFRR
jgi:hypothetical protein